MYDDDFRRLEGEFLTLARRIFDAGAKAERQRVLGLIQSGEAMTSAAVAPPSRKSAAKGFGSVSGPVRGALIQLAPESPAGVGPRQIAKHFARLGDGPDERQVRAALKTLTISGEAIRASRGRYLPRPAVSSAPIEEENPDAPASGDFDLAAE